MTSFQDILKIRQEASKRLNKTKFSLDDLKFNLIRIFTEDDNVSLQKLIDDGGDVNSSIVLYQVNLGTDLLEACAKNNSQKCLKVLIDSGININKKYGDNECNVIMRFIELNSTVGILSIILKTNIDINYKNKNGETALHVAVRNESSFRIIELLVISGGANINEKDNDGYTPLLIACGSEMASHYNLLRSLGADKDIKNNYGLTCKDLARGIFEVTSQVSRMKEDLFGSEKPIKAKFSLDDLKYDLIRIFMEDDNVSLQKLIDDGGDIESELSPNICNGNRFILSSCVHLNAVKCLDVLIKSGINMTRPEFNYGSILHSITFNNGSHDEIYKRILESGFDVNYKNKNGNTVLHLAAGHNNTNLAEMLIEFGANINEQNNLGETALFIASQHTRCAEIYNILVKAGADKNIKDNNGNECGYLIKHELEKLKMFEHLFGIKFNKVEDWFEVSPEPISIKNRHLINISKPIAVGPVGTNLMSSPSHIRGSPPCPKFVVAPWLQSSNYGGEDKADKEISIDEIIEIPSDVQIIFDKYGFDPQRCVRLFNSDGTYHFVDAVDHIEYDSEHNIIKKWSDDEWNFYGFSKGIINGKKTWVSFMSGRGMTP